MQIHLKIEKDEHVIMFARLYGLANGIPMEVINSITGTSVIDKPLTLIDGVIPAANNGSAQETVEEARQVTEMQDAHVEPYDKVLKDIQQLVGAIEEAGLRTRKEIVQMLQEQSVKKFTDLELGPLTSMRDQFVSLIEALKED